MAPSKKTKARSNHIISKWYKADDGVKHFVRRQAATGKKIFKTKLAPGTVLILLAGRFRGKRVVMLKQLASGLLLVTGPHKVNGVPLKRVNQAYVIPTSTKVPLEGINCEKIDDKYFGKTLHKYTKRNRDSFFKAHPDVIYKFLISYYEAIRRL